MSSKKRDSRQATFDFGDSMDSVVADGAIDTPVSEGAAGSGHTTDETMGGIKPIVSSSIWQEVPQALFLSWSHARQLDYCARRDEDSAVVDSDNREFYLQRAQWYRDDIRRS